MDAQEIQMDILEVPERRKRSLTPEQSIRRKRRRRKVKMIRFSIMCMTLLLSAGIIAGIIYLVHFVYGGMVQSDGVVAVQSQSIEEILGLEKQKWHDFYNIDLKRPELDVQLLTINEYSRPAEALPEIKDIFIHYTANPGTTALQNRSYFESLAETGERSASAHFIIDTDGSIVQCIPTKEIAYAVMQRNFDSLSIECCYENENGKFTQKTYESLIQLTAWLLHEFKLTPTDVLRHYDEGGKNCPKYYVENEEAWQQFMRDLENYMKSKTV